jgi:hypothetical protein
MLKSDVVTQCLWIILSSIIVFSCSTADSNGFYISDGYGLAIEVKRGRIKTYQAAGDWLVRFPLLDGRIDRGVLESVVDNYDVDFIGDQVLFRNYRGDLVVKFTPAERSS